MKKKSIGKNAILNGFRNVLNLLFPLITFPYISRVLSVDGIGKYNFAQSVISYFLLIAGLGISSYAIREGAKYRNEKRKLNIFVSEILFCNIISTLIAYIVLLFCIHYVAKFQEYTSLLLLFSIQIVFTTIGVEWIYSIYEEYEYITIRSIIFKVISIILLFTFVKCEYDVNVYAAITVFSSVGSNVLNLAHSRKYFQLTKICIRDCIKHIKPILIIFASNVAIMIYVYSDTTMLGFMTSNYEVGIYSVAVKIYNIVKNLLSAVLIVSIPRLSMYYGNGQKEEFNRISQKVFDTLTALILPAVVGLYCAAKQVILVIADKAYVSGAVSLRILCIALFFCIYSWFFSQCILMPANKEKIILVSTCVSAIANIGLNFILIPVWKQNATAFTTVLAEGIMFTICGFCGLKVTKIKILTRNMISVIFGCFSILAMCAINGLLYNIAPFLQLMILIVFSTVIYGLVLLIFRNTVIVNIWSEIIKK